MPDYTHERRRREPTDFERQVISDLAYLTSQMRGLVGNGQPGRIKELELDMQAMKEHKTRYSTYAVILGGILTLADHLAAAATNIAHKNAITLIPADISGAVGSSLPAAIPTAWHYLDFRGGNPTYLGGPFQWGTSTNVAKLGINTADLRVPGAMLDIEAPSGTPALTLRTAGASNRTLVLNTDAAATSLLSFKNNGTETFSVAALNGATKTLIIQSATKNGFVFDDTNNTVTVGGNTSTLNTITGSLLTLRRIKVSGTAPTCAFTTGGGTTPSCALDTGSTDLAGTIIATTGTGAPGNAGTITLTFSAAYGTNKPSCGYTLSNDGAGTWNVRATVIDETPSTTSDLFNWDNNAVALGTSTSFHINYSCFAK